MGKLGKGEVGGVRGKRFTAVGCGAFFTVLSRDGDISGGIGCGRAGVVAGACAEVDGVNFTGFFPTGGGLLDFTACFFGVTRGFPPFTPPRFTPLLLPVLFLVFRVFLVALPPFFVRLRRRPHFAVRFICIHIVRKNKAVTWGRTRPSKALQGRLAR